MFIGIIIIIFSIIVFIMGNQSSTFESMECQVQLGKSVIGVGNDAFGWGSMFVIGCSLGMVASGGWSVQHAELQKSGLVVSLEHVCLARTPIDECARHASGDDDFVDGFIDDDDVDGDIGDDDDVVVVVGDDGAYRAMLMDIGSSHPARPVRCKCSQGCK